MFLFAESVKSEYRQIIVSTKLEQPHVFFLYYLKYDPVRYLQSGGTASGGWAETRNKFDKYLFQPFDYQKMQDGSTLFVGLPSDFPSEVTPIKKIYYLDGTDAIWLVKG